MCEIIYVHLNDKPKNFQNHQQCKHKSIASSTINSTIPEKTAVQNYGKDEFTKIACMYCGRDFPNMKLMYQHVSVDHSAIFLSHNLNCGTETSSISKECSRKSYQQCNNLPNPTHIHCDLCTVQFETIESLKEHLKSTHWKIGGAQNEVQTMLQSKPTDLSRKRRMEDLGENDRRKSEDHNKRTSPSSATSLYDSNDKPCICSYCYVQMPNFKSFLLHMETHVSLNASNSFGFCPICGESTRDSIEFSSHIFKHVVADVTGRCCQQCKKSFDQLEQLQKHHLEVHSQNVYKCTICGELFESEIAIKVIPK